MLCLWNLQRWDGILCQKRFKILPTAWSKVETSETSFRKFSPRTQASLWSCTWNCQAKNSHDWRNACETQFFENSKNTSWKASDAKMRRISLSSDTIQRRISDMLEDVKDQVINESISNVFLSSGWVNRCYVMCSVSCFRGIYSFRRHWSRAPVLWETANCNKKCRCSGEVNLLWFFRVAVEICLWGLYWWSSCNYGITFRHSKKVQELSPKPKGALCHSEYMYLLAKLTNSSEKCSGFHFKFGSYTSNMEALTPACLNNSPKTCFRHTKFYSTHLYDGCWKETFQTTFVRWRTKQSYSQNWKQTSSCHALVTRFVWNVLLIWQKCLKDWIT